jgi:FixJ family two-component response regulator
MASFIRKYRVQKTVFVVDDDASIRKGLVRLLRSAGYAADAFESAEAFLQNPPLEGHACVVLDMSMPGLNGLELQEAITARGWVIPIVFLTGRGTIPATVRAMKGGAVDFLTKPVDEEDLLAAVERALDRARAEQREQNEIHALRKRFDSLTAREKEVMALVAAGQLNKQVAGKLGAAEKTIKVHRGRVMEKMQVASFADLVRAAVRLGLP